MSQTSVLRASGIPQLAGVPYKLLAGLDFVSYEENNPTENARKLNEHEVDLALIPAVDYALHGGYVALEFGMGTRRRTDSMVLYANTPLSSLKKVHIYQCSSSSLALLRLLCIECWGASPAFFRHEELEPFRPLGPDEAVLALHELPGMIRREYRAAEDLGTAWFKHTNLPFVFLVWAARPGTIEASKLRLINQQFHRGAKAAREMAIQHAAYYGTTPEEAAEFVGGNRRYYLDYYLQEGLAEFLRRAHKLNLLPETHYDGARKTLLAGIPAQRKEPSTEQILEGLAAGHRLAAQDALVLLNCAGLAQLDAAAADAYRARHPQTLSVVLQELEDEQAAIEAVTECTQKNQNTRLYLSLRSSSGQLSPIYRYEKLIAALRGKCSASLQAFSIPALIQLADRHGMSFEDAVNRVVREGVVVGSSGGEMLSPAAEGSAAEKWLTYCRRLHFLGRQSLCTMRFSPDDSAEDRLLHLQKLRCLQDETGGFTYFSPLPGKDDIDAETQAKEYLVALLFLDNMRTFIRTGEEQRLFNGLSLETRPDILFALQPASQD